MASKLQEMFDDLAAVLKSEPNPEKAYKSLLVLTEKGSDHYIWLHLLKDTFKDEK